MLATVMAEPEEVVLFAPVCQRIVLWSARWAMATELEEVEGHFASQRKTAVKSYFADVARKFVLA